METFAPQPVSNESTNFKNLQETTSIPPNSTKTQTTKPTKQSQKSSIKNKHEAKTVSVETDLYTAKVSSVNGGSIQNFYLQNFLTKLCLQNISKNLFKNSFSSDFNEVF